MYMTNRLCMNFSTVIYVVTSCPGDPGIETGEAHITNKGPS